MRGSIRETNDDIRLSGERSTYPVEFEPDSSVDRCRCCRVRFGLFRRKHHCRKCGLVVCASCSKTRFKLSGRDRKPVRICVNCTVEFKQPNIPFCEEETMDTASSLTSIADGRARVSCTYFEEGNDHKLFLNGYVKVTESSKLYLRFWIEEFRILLEIFPVEAREDGRIELTGRISNQKQTHYLSASTNVMIQKLESLCIVEDFTLHYTEGDVSPFSISGCLCWKSSLRPL